VAAVAAAVPRTEVDGELPSVTDMLVASGLASSRSDARRTVTEGGAYLNNERAGDPEQRPAAADLLHGRWLVLRRGKRTVAMVERRG
jgi:tyrosyl-tRNA synthetase